MSVILHWATSDSNQYWNVSDYERPYMELDAEQTPDTIPDSEQQVNHSNGGQKIQFDPYDKLEPDEKA